MRDCTSHIALEELLESELGISKSDQNYNYHLKPKITCVRQRTKKKQSTSK